MRGLAYNRDTRNKKIAEKKRKSFFAYGSDFYDKDGKYAKGKIHCSCPICKYSKFFGIKVRCEAISDYDYMEQMKDLTNISE